MKAFAAYVPKKKNPSHIMRIQQRQNESLRRYVKRFRGAASEIQDLPAIMALVAMVCGTTHEPLKNSLSLVQPSTLRELYARAEQYVAQMDFWGGGEKRQRERQPDREDSME